MRIKKSAYQAIALSKLRQRNIGRKTHTRKAHIVHAHVTAHAVDARQFYRFPPGGIYFSEPQVQEEIIERSEYIKSFHKRKLREDIEKLQSKLAEVESKCREFDATIVLLKRADQERTNERLRLLKILRNPMTGSLLKKAYELGQLHTENELENFIYIRVAVELCELGQMEYQKGRFGLTATGRKLVEKLSLV